jgi:hypothetical protein
MEVHKVLAGIDPPVVGLEVTILSVLFALVTFDVQPVGADACRKKVVANGGMDPPVTCSILIVTSPVPEGGVNETPDPATNFVSV